MGLRKIHPALSVFPGYSPHRAMQALSEVQSDGGFEFDLSKIQITPQNFCPWTPEALERFIGQYPDTQFRLHASIRLAKDTVSDKVQRFPWYDLQRFIEDPVGGTRYFARLGELNAVLGNPVYTFHSGSRPSGRDKVIRPKMIEAMGVIGELLNAPVAIETLYPRKQLEGARVGMRRHWMDTWEDHAWLLFESDLNYVVDLSHLNIIAAAEGPNITLTRSLLSNPRMLELHLSGNNGTADQHTCLATTENAWWQPLLSDVHSGADWFTEGSLRQKKKVAAFDVA